MKKRKSSSRPWRLLGTKPGEKQGTNIPHACYARELSVHEGALRRAWLGEYRTVEVHNINTGRELGTYTRHADGALTFSTSDATMIRLLKEWNDG